MSTQTEHAAAITPEWTLGDRLRKARHHAGMGQKEFAEALGTTPGSLATWETDRSRPRDLIALAKRVEMLTRIPATWLLGLDSENPRQEGPDGGSSVRHQGLEPRTR